MPGDTVSRKKPSAIAKGLMNYISECQPKSHCQNVHFISVKAEKICISFLLSFFLLNGKQLILRVKSNLNSRKGYLQFVFKKSLKPYLMPYKTDSEINEATLHVGIYFLQSKQGGRVCDILGSSGLEQPTHLYFRLL